MIPTLGLESSGIEWILLAVGGVITVALAIVFFIVLRKENGKS